MLWRVRKSTGVVQTGGAENSVLPGNTGATGLNVAEKRVASRLKEIWIESIVLSCKIMMSKRRKIWLIRQRKTKICLLRKQESKTAVRGRFGETA